MSLAAIALLLAIMLPALSAARISAQKAHCAANQRVIGQAWLSYVDEHGNFPEVYHDPAWSYGGVRFNVVNRWPYLDFSRPLNRHLAVNLVDGTAEYLYQCPADTGISDPDELGAGTGQRTAFEAFGTSYRANSRLLDARLARVDEVQRPLRLAEVTTNHSEMVVMGTPVWFEVLARTGRAADWFGKPRPEKLISGSTTAGQGNMLFLDGSVRFVIIDRDSQRVLSMFEPRESRTGETPEFPDPAGANALRPGSR
jgi:prepilin-type processing-associated H-X9-DG protein